MGPVLWDPQDTPSGLVQPQDHSDSRLLLPPPTQGVPGVPAALEQATMRQFAGGPEDPHAQVSAWRGQSRAARCERDLGAGEFCAMVGGGAWGPRYAFAAYFPLTGGPRSPLTLSPAVWAQLVSQPPLTTSPEAPDAVCA